MDRFRCFQQIKAAYDGADRACNKRRVLPMRSTRDGFWCTSPMDALYGLFVRTGLDRARSFLDIGSGDGRVVLIASLFTQAAGAESDAELHARSESVRDDLGLEAELHCGDYLELDWTGFEVLYHFPDKAFQPEFEKKLMRELNGRLFVYNNVYLPYCLKLVKTWWIGRLPLVEFAR